MPEKMHIFIKNAIFRQNDEYSHHYFDLSKPAVYSTKWLTINLFREILNHMVNNQEEQLNAVFHALADPTRRAMVARLAQAPCGISELAAPFDMTLAAASKHIKVLEGAGLVVRNIQGRNHTCQLDTRPMHGGIEWLRHYEQFWNQRLDALTAALMAEDQDTTDKTD